MAERKSYDLFIVHAWRYHDDWNRMVALIDSIPDFKWRNFSLPWFDPSIEPHLEDGKARLDKSLDGQIVPAHCVLYAPSIFVSVRTDKWLETAVERIRALNKPVIVVSDAAEPDVPDVIRPLVKATVSWDSAAIKQAIVQNSL